MSLEDLKAKIEDFKSLKKEDLEGALQEMRDKFQEKTGLDLDMVVKSYKTAWAGTEEEKVELRAEVLEKGTETEYWLGHGMTYGDRTIAAVVLEAIGTKVPNLKYVARVLGSYVFVDALLSAVDRCIGGLVREGVGKVKEKVEHVKSDRAGRTGGRLADLFNDDDDDDTPVELGEPKLPEEKEENPYF